MSVCVIDLRRHEAGTVQGEKVLGECWSGDFDNKCFQGKVYFKLTKLTKNNIQINKFGKMNQ